MSRQRIYPHRTAAEGSVEFGSWWYRRGGELIALPELLEDWDYATEVEVGIDLTLNEELLLASTGLDGLEDFAVALLVDCPEAQERVTARVGLLDEQGKHRASLSLVIPPRKLAGTAYLSAHLVLADDLASKKVGRASRKSSRLASSDPHRLILEGNAARFPVEAASFASTGRPPVPWLLHIASSDIRASFLGNVRLFVNTDHPAGAMLLDTERVSVIQPFVFSEVIRLLVAEVASKYNIEEIEEALEAEESIASVTDEITETQLSLGLPQAVMRYTDDPLTFETLIHERLTPLTGLFSD